MGKNDLITDKQAAEILGVKPTYLAFVRHTHRQTKLPYQMVGRHSFYRRDDVEAFRDARIEKKKHSRKKAKNESGKKWCNH